MGLFDEWRENPPADVFVAAYFGYERPSEKPQAGDKWFGEDQAAAAPAGISSEDEQALLDWAAKSALRNRADGT
jgi:hypothetical protein